MGYMNNGVGTLVPSIGTEISVLSNRYINETKVSTPKERNNDKENELKKIGISDFLIKLTKVKQVYLYFKERTKDELTKVEKAFIEQIEYSAKKLKGKK